jgi:methylated-DNA-[protein]-cysteine S-methyltransferase
MSVNPLPMIVPCHRVVESDRTIGGFSGSVELKLKLLELEKVKIFNGKIDKTFFINL